jgi:adenylate cyclase
MAHEIERKFLVRSDAWRADASKAGVSGVRIRQGYLSTSTTRSVRVRTAGERATLNVKGNKVGPRATEFEYSIPLEDALQMLGELCRRPHIEKTRYDIPGPDGLIWEVDDFHAENAGLVVAEIELSHEDLAFARPDWLGEEVTDDPRYLNTSLAERPFTTWEREEGSRD